MINATIIRINPIISDQPTDNLPNSKNNIPIINKIILIVNVDINIIIYLIFLHS